ncbi:OLC1v1025304C1 [Oldenlandia corymbosa var. corymbosa]|uniref:OLC1v1025304C1 n=1 Tax=Oldenlandia corymbosa var. corymbosa TaxID=529605 RepID=A0AAV1C6T3_OLDCO|nr:OLC1v1025304C1 [Oldenlandia corymbosa var. corymbosa]
MDLTGFRESSLHGQMLRYTDDYLSGMFQGAAGPHQAYDEAGGADQQDQFEG